MPFSSTSPTHLPWWKALVLSILLHLPLAAALCLAVQSSPESPKRPQTQERRFHIGLQGNNFADFYLARGPEGELSTSITEPVKSPPADNQQDIDKQIFQARLVLNAAPAIIDEPGISQPASTSAHSLPSTSGRPGGGHDDNPRGGGTVFFDVATQAQKIVYVIDRSSSMGRDGRWASIRSQLWASVESLPETAQFQIIVYNSSACPLVPSRPGWMLATRENRLLVAEALVQLTAEGGTRHHLALPMALALQPDVIFFLTDADDLTPEYLQHVSRLNRQRAAIHVIALTTHHSRPNLSLQTFAQQNGGQYAAVGVEKSW